MTSPPYWTAGASPRPTERPETNGASRMPRPTVSSKLRTVCFDRTRLPRPPYYFRGMALMAARRAKPVQRTCSQGLQGNRDACHLRRGSACDISAKGAGGNARLVFASSVQPTAAMSPRLGGAGGAPPAPSFPPFLREEMGAPAAQARPRGAPITAGDHRSPLHRRPKLRIIRWASSPHDDHSVGSPRGAPLSAPSRIPGHLLLPRWGNSPCRAPPGMCPTGINTR